MINCTVSRLVDKSRRPLFFKSIALKNFSVASKEIDLWACLAMMI